MAALLTTSPLVKTYTLEEFWALPDPPDRSKLELIAGVLYMSPPPNRKHNDRVTRLLHLLMEQILALQLGGDLRIPRDAIWISPNTYLEPDLFYVSEELKRREGDHWSKADLVVEVVSPGSEIYDRTTKADTYGALGVRELWLVYESSQTIEVRINSGNRFGPGQVFGMDGMLVSAAFPKLQLRVRDVFADE